MVRQAVILESELSKIKGILEELQKEQQQQKLISMK
jgi:hypothetical protein